MLNVLMSKTKYKKAMELFNKLRTISSSKLYNYHKKYSVFSKFFSESRIFHASDLYRSRFELYYNCREPP